MIFCTVCKNIVLYDYNTISLDIWIMKHVLKIFLFSFFLLNIAQAQEFEFIVNDTQTIKTATIESYQQALYDKSVTKRKDIIRKGLLQYVNLIENAEIYDFSYRYKKKSIQKRALSCEISVASDILARHTGRRISEDYLVRKIEKSEYRKLPKIVDGKTVWGNPNEGFVWHIDRLNTWEKASQWNMTGYWVLEKPIQKLYESFGLKTKIITEKSHRPSFDENNHLTVLLENIEKWNSVQLWWDYCTRPEYEDTEEKNTCKTLNNDRTLEWYYRDQNNNLKKHRWLAWEHAFFLLGYTWTRYNPQEIIVWDSQTGKHSYKKAEWMRKWKMMQYRSIIIYDDKK